MRRKSARLNASAAPKTGSRGQSNARELVARQTEEIKDLKHRLKQKNEELKQEKEARAHLENEVARNSQELTDEIEHLGELLENQKEDINSKLDRIHATIGSMEALEEEREGLKEIRQKTVGFMRSQLQEEVDKTGKPFGWQLCGICTIRFSGVEEHTPRVLNCGHTLCLGCIKKIMKENENNKVKCPTCREYTYFAKVTGIPKNFTVSEMCE